MLISVLRETVRVSFFEYSFFIGAISIKLRNRKEL